MRAIIVHVLAVILVLAIMTLALIAMVIDGILRFVRR